MADNLTKLDRWIAVHTKLTNYFQPVHLGMNEKEREQKWHKFCFGKVEFDGDSLFSGFFLHWLGLRTSLPGKRATIAQTLKGCASSLRLSADESILLDVLLGGYWNFYRVLEVDKEHSFYRAKEFWTDKEFTVTGRAATRNYQPGFIILTMLIPIDGIIFSVGSLPTAFKESVTSSIDYFMRGKINAKGDINLKAEEMIRKIGFDLYGMGGALGVGDTSKKEKTIQSIYDIDMAAKRMQRECPEINGTNTLNLASDFLSEMILNSPQFNIMGQNLKSLASISEHRELVIEVIDFFSQTDVIKKHGTKFATRFAANAFDARN